MSYYHQMKLELERIGVRFSVEGRSDDESRVWIASLDGEVVSSHKYMADCIDGAAKALGGV